ncbi:pentatricopeptide repeat-containing protein at2g02980 [Phtheirospermum japonicum]|uniref:Pentatricopeptide repeat-containing protein at2g02980 n=1 Tax=Phtheirospermum japonicum TaxID=374723 RepID=A0A830D4E6_9LAMI|nr:pentatricopeptide repeat-containing protein at2g02980 [Phtheirospermum japonicum]
MVLTLSTFPTQISPTKTASFPENPKTFILEQCKTIKDLKQVHAHLIKTRLLHRPAVAEPLLESAALLLPVPTIDYALSIFSSLEKPDPSAYAIMIRGFTKLQSPEKSILLFRQMIEHSVRPDEFTFPGVLKACSKLRALKEGEQIHAHVVKNGLMRNDSLMTSLVDMYAKCGRVDTAFEVFDKMFKRDVVAWSAMISGYSRSNRPKQALALFQDMQNSKVEPNEVTMLSVLSSCAVLGALRTGEWVHSYIKKKKLKLTINLGTTLVDFYAKCGCVERAIEVFDKMPSKNIWTWTALIQGLASNGRGQTSLHYYNSMLGEKVKPNDVTFIGVLSACNHAGLVDEGRKYFVSMKRDFGIEPRIEHYGCMVDMLGRVGLIEEAYGFIKNMPIKPNAVIWRTLLASCRVHKNVEIGEEALKHAVRLEPAHSGDYILLSNLYASIGRLEDARKLRNEMKILGIKKLPGFSYIELDGIVHEFLAEDKRHPQSLEIYKAVENMMERIKMAGYEPDKVQARLEADEKLAVAFGLIRSTPGDTIRISKNLRICTDCHNATKIVSKVFGREIVIRDRNRFHHFKDGLCSCGDFW